MEWISRAAVRLAETGRIPDPVLRWGIRRICDKRLRDDVPVEPDARAAALDAFIEQMDTAPIAPVPERANQQHYEVPADFFRLVLGPRLKYSCCFFPNGVTDLAAAEEAALETTAERAGLADGQEILDLGCGWGSVTLWAAERFPGSRITAVSNSAVQRAAIEARAAAAGLDNVRVITCDVNAFEPGCRFDRIVSVEMFEHMRNYRRLLGRIQQWLAPGGRLFVHVFCHRQVPYAFHDRGADDWMARHFFTGGIMPSDDLLPRFAGGLELLGKWRWDGTHYQKTAEAWLANLDANAGRAGEILGAPIHVTRWRLFFLGCSELFGYRGGSEWWVVHHLFGRAS